MEIFMRQNMKVAEIMMLFLYFATIGLVYGDRKPLSIQIDLDLPPEERWIETCKKHTYMFHTMAKFAESAVMPKVFQPYVNYIFKKLDVYLPPDIYGELKGMASATQLDIGVFAMFNMLYDVVAFSHSLEKFQYRGCTSIVAQDGAGKIWHGRNLDYGEIGGLDQYLRNMTMQVQFMKNGKVAFTGTTYAGLLGIFTGQKANAFTLSLDERDQGSVFENLNIILTKNFTFTSVLARKAMEDATSFEDVVSHVSNAVTPSPSYFILGGAEAGQGAVVTRDRFSARDVWRLNPANNTWFLVETNYDHWLPAPSQDDRRDVAIKAMNNIANRNVTSDALFGVLSIQPVYNGGTTYTTIMSAAQPDIYYTLIRDKI